MALEILVRIVEQDGQSILTSWEREEGGATGDLGVEGGGGDSRLPLVGEGGAVGDGSTSLVVEGHHPHQDRRFFYLA